jgi:hypothetical protein
MKLKLLSFQPDQSIPLYHHSPNSFSPLYLKIPRKTAKLNKMVVLKPEHKNSPMVVIATQMIVVLYTP